LTAASCSSVISTFFGYSRSSSGAQTLRPVLVVVAAIELMTTA
jgi:hypothetical protein